MLKSNKAKNKNIPMLITITITIIIIIGIIYFVLAIYSNKKDNQIDSTEKTEIVCQFEQEPELFIVEIPTNYTYELVPGWDASEGVEASPDRGLKIYLDTDNKDEYIYLYESFSNYTYSLNNSLVEIVDLNNGKLYISKEEKEGNPIANVKFNKNNSTEFYGGIISMEKEVFENNYTEIINLLESFHLSKENE